MAEMETSLSQALDVRRMANHLQNVESNSVKQSILLSEMTDAVREMTNVMRRTMSQGAMPDEWEDARLDVEGLLQKARQENASRQPVPVKEAVMVETVEKISEPKLEKNGYERKQPRSSKKKPLEELGEKTATFIQWMIDNGHIENLETVTINSMWTGAKEGGVKIGRTMVGKTLSAMKDGEYDDYIDIPK